MDLSSWLSRCQVVRLAERQVFSDRNFPVLSISAA